AGKGFDDMARLGKLIGKAKIVALGEATHGSREFFQFKHRMLEFLVREMGFTVFAIEASASACLNINDYVMGRTDSGAAALDSQGYWTWNTVEVMDMINWMRAYNRSVTVERRVSFVGIDMQVNAEAYKRLITYLYRVDSELAIRMDSLPRPWGVRREHYDNSIEGISSLAFDADSASSSMLHFATMRKQYASGLHEMTLRADDMVARSSMSEFDTAFFHLSILNQYIDAFAPDAKPGVRDQYLADNLARYVRESGPTARVVLWAHNAHIRKGEGQGVKWMGNRLNEKFRDQYYAIGLTFDQGAFQSRDVGTDGKSQLAEFTIGSAPHHMLEWYLASTRRELFFIDLRNTERKSVDVVNWLAAPHYLRSVGSTYANELGPTFVEYIPSRDFDGLVFIRRTSRARPNSSVSNVRTTQRVDN
ncbi:MAG: erythromycin esterase family protein, partial [bacterium]|nr:erythromycin esterase family protein [Candidatus Kapabacteria bacterium]